ncbi:kielin/chordin-like protein [Tribolium castaneum]|nr:PREDICTED: kielin/chordin-like protein [Tribolium castaneum]|eukprot:XP_008197141.1 PREDICTED: kielin/chordin-like protein [Tribolium castaneum]
MIRSFSRTPRKRRRDAPHLWSLSGASKTLQCGRVQAMDTLLSVVFLFFTVLAKTGRTNAVPLSALSPVDVASNSVGDDAAEDGAILDDFTTHGLERLSSAATCLVAGVEYTHGQQIYRPDPCEFCLCLDGEMFCWWQDCPPTMEGPCRDRGPFTPCLNTPSASTAKSTPVEHELTSESETPDNSTDSAFTSEMNSTEESPATTQQARFCLVMGRKYEVGDKLPHNTGNCVECVCGPGAKVTCSPHQCAPVGEDINDYRPPGPRQPDVF